MRFTSIIFAGLFAILANAQSTTLPPATTTSLNSAEAAQSSAQASVIACLNACAAGDVTCQSKCIAVPDPSATQANSTVQCAENCPQGNGTAADNQAYAECIDGCIGQFYFTTTGTPNAQTTGAGAGASVSTGTASASASGSNSQSASASGSSGSSASGSSSAAASSSSTAAGDVLHVAGPAAGFLGFLAALLAI